MRNLSVKIYNKVQLAPSNTLLKHYQTEPHILLTNFFYLGNFLIAKVNAKFTYLWEIMFHQEIYSF